MPETATTPRREAADPLAADLGSVLDRLHAEHERLAIIAGARRRAIALADARAMAACIAQENEAVQRIAEIDAEREGIAARAERRFGRPADAGDEWRPTLSWIASRLPEPQRGALTSAASRLRALIERLRTDNAALAQAAETLAGHMTGIIRAVEGRLSHSGAYTPRGVVSAGPAVITAMDVTT